MTEGKVIFIITSSNPCISRDNKVLTAEKICTKSPWKSETFEPLDYEILSIGPGKGMERRGLNPEPCHFGSCVARENFAKFLEPCTFLARKYV